MGCGDGGSCWDDRGGGQSLVIGLVAGSRDGGTGLLWGEIIAIPSAVSGIWLGWYSVIVALGASLLVGVASLCSMWWSG